mmetsp:Transcript_149154/g.285841  ORF Transcript_149154/g.285841 Transcript_149154/m.285841 type:complete len:208 (-) Transcript_149154:47-670(-)
MAWKSPSPVAKRGYCFASVLLYALGRAGASDPCFAKQQFGEKFDVKTNGVFQPPRVEAGDLLVQVEYTSCEPDGFNARLQERSSGDSICAVWLERDFGALPSDAVACVAGGLRRFSHEVRLPLPAASQNCTTLLFAFPPGQQYEYYNLAAPKSKRTPRRPQPLTQRLFAKSTVRAKPELSRQAGQRRATIAVKTDAPVADLACSKRS